MSSATPGDDHQRMREALGSYALGHLDGAEVAQVRAHLDGCAACRAELAELEPLVPLLDAVDPDAFDAPPAPPAALGQQIRDAVAAESARREVDELAQRRHTERAVSRRRTVLTVAAAAVVVAGLGVGAVVGRATAPDTPATVARPYEPIALEPVAGAPVDVGAAGLVPHTWGVELEMEAAGFDEGEVYSAAFRDERGAMQPAGRFLGTGGAWMTCSLQSGVMREDVAAVVVRDAAGRTVLRSRL